MNSPLILLSIVSLFGLASCNSVSHVDYSKESSRVRNFGSKDDIVGVWQSKAVFDTPLTVSGTIHKTVRLEPGGRGTYRTKAQAASGGLPFIEETPLHWQYAQGLRIKIMENRAEDAFSEGGVHRGQLSFRAD